MPSGMWQSMANVMLLRQNESSTQKSIISGRHLTFFFQLHGLNSIWGGFGLAIIAAEGLSGAKMSPFLSLQNGSSHIQKSSWSLGLIISHGQLDF